MMVNDESGFVLQIGRREEGRGKGERDVAVLIEPPPKEVQTIEKLSTHNLTNSLIQSDPPFPRNGHGYLKKVFHRCAHQNIITYT